MPKKLGIKLFVLIATLLVVTAGGWYFIIGTPQERAQRLFIDGVSVLIKNGGAGCDVIPMELVRKGLPHPLKAIATQENYKEIYNNALGLLFKSLEIDPDNRRVYYFIGTAYMMLAYFNKLGKGNAFIGYAKNAINYYKISIDYKKYVPESLRSMCIAYGSIGNWELAYTIAEKYSWQGEPYWINGKYLMALMQICKGNYKMAHEIASSMLQGEKSYATAQLIFAIILYKNNRSKEAVNIFKELIKRYPSKKKYYSSFQNKLENSLDEMCW